jgi:hypothetical protein
MNLKPDQIYQRVINNCECKPINRRKNRYSAFITLGYDFQEFGVTEQIAKHNLAYRIYNHGHPGYQVQLIINKSLTTNDR